MTRYKKSRVFVRIDDQNKFWIIAENYKIINKNPTKEEMSRTNHMNYNLTNICPRCREEYERGDRDKLTDKSILYPGNARQEVGKNGKITGEYVCNNHSYKSRQRHDPNSQNNIFRSLRDVRTGNLRDRPNILAHNCEKLTENWLGAERTSVRFDKYSQLPLDHGHITKHILVKIGGQLVDLYGKVPQTKGASLTVFEIYTDTNIYTYDAWRQSFVNDHNKEFDILILYCTDKDGKSIERIYIIPKEELSESGTTICKNRKAAKMEELKHEKNRIIDDEILKYVNEIWKNIKLCN